MNKEDSAYWNEHGVKVGADRLKAFLYSLWSGKFIGTEVAIHIIDSRNYGEFKAFAKTKSGKISQVSIEPGVLYNGIVWFEERNDDAASFLLIKHSEQAILKLKETIENHEYKISLIKQGVIEK